MSFEPVGDAPGMRALARELATRAELLTDAHTRPAKKLDAAQFEGPAALRLRDTADEVATRVRDAAADLDALARNLLADADRVEAENDLLEREARAEAEKLAEQQARDATAVVEPLAEPTP